MMKRCGPRSGRKSYSQWRGCDGGVAHRIFMGVRGGRHSNHFVRPLDKEKIMELPCYWWPVVAGFVLVGVLEYRRRR
jgi:hypothetical protein